jgi:hypothetical protein
VITTTSATSHKALVIHRVTGLVNRLEASQGAAEALHYVQSLSPEHPILVLLLDLRGMRFQELQAHQAWSIGFARNPILQDYIRAVAIIGDDTPHFSAEQELMQTDRVHFFLDPASGERWLAEFLHT